MLEDEPIYTGLECPQCGTHLDTPPDGAHGEILCPECRAIVMFATSEGGGQLLTSLHKIPVPSDMLEPEESTASHAADDANAAPAVPEDDEDADQFRVSAAEAPQPQTWFLPPPLPEERDAPDDELVEPEAAPAVRESLAKTFLSGVFTYPWQLTALKQWVLLAVFAFLTFEVGLTIATEFSMEPGTRWGSGFFYIFPGLALLAYTLAYGGAYLAAITERTAYHIDTGSEWPDGDWRQRFLEGIRVGFLLTQVAMVSGFIAGLVSLGAVQAFWPVCLVCVFFLFPIVFLSALAENSLALPVSLPIWRSLGVCWRAWAAFYAVAAVIWLAWLAVVVLVPRADLVWPLVVGPLWAAAVFAYGRLLGRLGGYLMRHGGFLVPEPELI